MFERLTLLHCRNSAAGSVLVPFIPRITGAEIWRVRPCALTTQHAQKNSQPTVAVIAASHDPTVVSSLLLSCATPTPPPRPPPPPPYTHAPTPPNWRLVPVTSAVFIQMISFDLSQYSNPLTRYKYAPWWS